MCSARVRIQVRSTREFFPVYRCGIERKTANYLRDGEQSRDFTYIANVVDANLKAAESDSAVGQVINIANGERVTINEVFEMVKKLTGRLTWRLNMLHRAPVMCAIAWQI